MKRLDIVLLVGFVSISLSAVACGGGGEESPPAAETGAPAAVEEAPASPPAESESPAGDAETSETSGAGTSERPRLVPAVRGMAEIGYLTPETRRARGEVITTFEIKNLAIAAIAGLTIDEFWYDGDGNTVTGDSHRLLQPLLPGEEVSVELAVPSSNRLRTSKYSFSHQNGDIKATLLDEFPPGEDEGEDEGEGEDGD